IMAACLVATPTTALVNALLQFGLFISTLWFCYHGGFALLGVKDANFFASLLEKSSDSLRLKIYLEQVGRWSFFFAFTTVLCGLLVRQVWSREERLRIRERNLEQ